MRVNNSIFKGSLLLESLYLPRLEGYFKVLITMLISM